MKRLEIFIFGFLFFSTLSIYFPSLRKISRSIFFLAALLFILIVHFALEGLRWQMTAAYILSLIYILHAFIHHFRKRKMSPEDGNRKKSLSIKIPGTLIALFFLISLSLPVLFPFFKLPLPTGPYAVGTTYISVTDFGRSEIFTPDQDDFRTIFARIWYPAKRHKNKNAVPYMAADEYKAIAYYESMPPLLYSDLPSIKTHSYLNANLPDNDRIFPVLFFSHGAGGHILTHTILMEELASHGYVVFNIAHPYLTAFARDEEGQIISYDRKYVDQVIREATSREIESIKDQILSTNRDKEREDLFKEIISFSPQTLTAVHMRTLDIKTIIDHIHKLDYRINNFASRLDTSKLGVFGFSLGGATAAQACTGDFGIRAGINIDGIMIGDFMEKTISVPFMFMTSEQMAMNINGRIRDQFHEIFYRKINDMVYSLAIKNTTHANLTDWSIFGGLLKLTGVLGKIDGYRCSKIIRLYIRSFFDKHLKEKKTTLLTDPVSQYPEVQLQYQNHCDKKIIGEFSNGKTQTVQIR